MTYFALKVIDTNEILVSPFTGIPILFITEPKELNYNKDQYELVEVEVKEVKRSEV